MSNLSFERAVRKRNGVLAASLLFMIIGTGSIYFVVVALKLISAEFHWPRTIPSIAYALQYLGGGFGGILMGYCLDRVGMGIPAFLGAIMIGVGAVFTSYMSSEWELYFIYGIMMGFLGRSTIFSPLMANIMRWFDHNKSFAVGIVGSGGAFAGVLWPPVFQIFFETIGWRETAFWYGIFVLLTLLPLALVLCQRPPSVAPVATASAASSPELNRGSAPRRSLPPFTMQASLCIASVGCCVAMSLPLAHLFSHVNDLGYEMARGAEILSLTLAAGSLSSLIGVGYLGKRYGGLVTILVFSSAQALSLAMLAFVDILSGIYIVAMMFGFGYGGVLPCYPIIVREHLPPAESGRRTATVILFAGGGMAVGSWLGGAIFDVLGSYTMAFLIGAGFNAGNLAIITMLILKTRPVPSRLSAR